MLEHVGLLTAEERSVIHAALDRVSEELGTGTFAFAPTDEDIHTAIERRVTEIAGGTGAKIHTGRSRNDQVALDLRLYVRREGHEQIARIHTLQEVLLRRAGETTEVALPGFTHLQRAQPVLLAHHLLAHFWSFSRDVDRWRDCLERVDVSPLGAGALAGSSLPLDPSFSASELGFRGRFQNSLDAVSDRDFVAEALFAATLTQLHLSRIGEEIVLWSSEEFGFVRLADAYATGSSMLPQKKNPDIAELARGKAGRLIGDLTGLLATLKGLPLAYNRDLQEDKEPLFDALDTCALSLAAVAGLIDTLMFVEERMTAAADSPVNAATDLAEHLVEQGTPFREAHALVGEPRAPGRRAGRPPRRVGRERSPPGAERASAARTGQCGPPAHDARRRRTWSRRPPTRRRRPSSRGAATLARAVTLKRGFYDRDALRVAPELLNKVLVAGPVRARLVEVEAYRGGDDPGAHSYRGKTARNATMFGRPGSLYVYFSYGMHWCANAVCGPGATPHAVLLRAAAPLVGLDVMRDRRVKARRDVDLARGPGRLGQALGFDRTFDGIDLTRGPVRIVDDGVAPPSEPAVSTRIGLADGQGERVALPLLRAGRSPPQRPGYGKRARIQSATSAITAGR